MLHFETLCPYNRLEFKLARPFQVQLTISSKIPISLTISNSTLRTVSYTVQNNTLHVCLHGG
jgi:hypothetical protein